MTVPGGGGGGVAPSSYFTSVRMNHDDEPKRHKTTGVRMRVWGRVLQNLGWLKGRLEGMPKHTRLCCSFISSCVSPSADRISRPPDPVLSDHATTCPQVGNARIDYDPMNDMIFCPNITALDVQFTPSANQSALTDALISFNVSDWVDPRWIMVYVPQPIDTTRAYIGSAMVDNGDAVGWELNYDHQNSYASGQLIRVEVTSGRRIAAGRHYIELKNITLPRYCVRDRGECPTRALHVDHRHNDVSGPTRAHSFNFHRIGEWETPKSRSQTNPATPIRRIATAGAGPSSALRILGCIRASVSGVGLAGGTFAVSGARVQAAPLTST